MEKVRNPKTGRLIDIDGPTFTKLIEESHYTRDELLANELTPLPGQLPQDVIYNILLQSNIYQLKNLCFVDKYNYKICSSLYFWETIFERDGLPLFEVHTKAEDWISDYFKIEELTTLVNSVIKNINKYKTVKLYVNDHGGWIRQFISLEKQTHKTITIKLISKNVYEISSTLDQIHVNKNDLKLILLKTFYYYRRVDLTTLRDDSIMPKQQTKNVPIAKRVKFNKRSVKNKV